MASPCSGGISRWNPHSLRLSVSPLAGRASHPAAEGDPTTDCFMDLTQLLRPSVDGLPSSIRCGYPASRDLHKVKWLQTEMGCDSVDLII